MGGYKCKKYEIVDETIDGRLLKVLSGSPRSLREVLESAVAARPHEEGFICGGRVWTFERFGKEVRRISASLQQRFDVRKGDRVAILMETDLEYPLCLFAITGIGAIAVPLNSRFTAEELTYEINNSGSSVLVIDGAFQEILRPFQNLLTTIRHIFVRGTPALSSALPFSALFDENVKEPAYVPVSEDDVAMLMYTSGTTGRPKGAMQIHRGIILSCMLLDDIIQADHQRDKMLNVLPMFHSAGTIMAAFSAVYMKIPCVYMHKFKTEPVLEVLEKEAITIMVHVPSIYWLIANHPDFERFDLKSFRMGITGGAPKSKETFELIMRKMPWARFVDTFGMTETHTVDFVLEHDDMRANIASVGRAVPIEEVKIVDKEGDECPPNVPGEILIKGPKIVPGYWNNPQGTREAIEDGWLHTGDVGKIDENGYVYILDRIKDMINRGGENIYSVEVENAISRNSKVGEVAVVGVPDKVLGEVVKAYVIPKAGETLNADELREHCAHYLADYKIPKYVEFVSDFPRNETGKIMKKALRERHGS